MKTIVRFLVLALLAIVIKAQAQPLPIVRADVLRNFALGQVVRGYRDVEAPSLINTPTGKSWAVVDGVGAEDVIQKLLAEQLEYSLANLNDTITGRLWLYNAKGMVVFYGQAQYTADQIGGKQAPSYGIWMQRIGLLEGVHSAEILVVDEQGQTNPDNSIPLEVKDGQVQFSESYCGRPNGIMVVQFEDGRVSTYRLTDPNPQDLPTIDDGSSDMGWQIPGHHVYLESPKDVVGIEILETYHLPTAYIVATKGQQFRLSVRGLVQADGRTFFESAQNFTFEQTDGPWAGGGMLQGNSPVITFPAAGRYRLGFSGWVYFGQPGNFYSGPSTGGGGGGGKGAAVK